MKASTRLLVAAQRVDQAFPRLVLDLAGHHPVVRPQQRLQRGRRPLHVEVGPGCTIDPEQQAVGLPGVAAIEVRVDAVVYRVAILVQDNVRIFIVVDAAMAVCEAVRIRNEVRVVVAVDAVGFLSCLGGLRPLGGDVHRHVEVAVRIERRALSLLDRELLLPEHLAGVHVNRAEVALLRAHIHAVTDEDRRTSGGGNFRFPQQHRAEVNIHGSGRAGRRARTPRCSTSTSC